MRGPLGRRRRDLEQQRSDMSRSPARKFRAAAHAAVVMCAAVALPIEAQTGASVNRSAPREVVTQFAFGAGFGMGADLSLTERRAIEAAPILERDLTTVARERLLGHPAFFVTGQVSKDTTLWQETMFVFLLAEGTSPRVVWSAQVREFTLHRDPKASYDVTSCVFVLDDSTLAQQLIVEPPAARTLPRAAALLKLSGVYRWRALSGSGAAGRFDQVGPVDDSTRRDCEESPMRDPD
jgi:hypothetical protein